MSFLRIYGNDIEPNENEINMEQKTETLIELKARAYDASVQVKAWQDILAKINNDIVNYVAPSENGKNVIEDELQIKR